MVGTLDLLHMGFYVGSRGSVGIDTDYVYVAFSNEQ